MSGRGQRADIGETAIYRILPNRWVRSVGPFVFLDYITPQVNNQSLQRSGTGAHPHRGIATLSYVLQGENKHFDSAGHYAKVGPGGIQWMKAGKGIIHYEALLPNPSSNSKIIQGFQFWINLPGKYKLENPEYLAIQAEDVPKKDLAHGAGWIKIMAGNYKELHSIIPEFSDQFLYHIQLNAGGQFTMETKDQCEYGLFLPDHEALINDADVSAGEFILFANDNGKIEISNPGNYIIHILTFGGAQYKEPIVAEGPFVMNSNEELAEAYQDFYLGKYGEIDYLKILESL